MEAVFAGTPVVEQINASVEPPASDSDVIIVSLPVPGGGTATSESVGDMDSGAAALDADTTILEACAEAVQRPFAAHESQAPESRMAIDATMAPPAPSGGTAT